MIREKCALFKRFRQKFIEFLSIPNRSIQVIKSPHPPKLGITPKERSMTPEDWPVIPMELMISDAPYDGPDTLFQVKWDGVRCLA